ncbi:MAG: DUF362 domain-containing protein [Candidatus Thermoplasmatota archaeon]
MKIPKKRKIKHKLKNAKGIWFHIAGIACLIWFLIRVIPKPTRSQYPCQQVAIPVALGYIAFWSILFQGTIFWIKKAKRKTTKIAPALMMIFVLLFSITGISFAENFQDIEKSNTEWTPNPKEPIGSPAGYKPGRVVWTWNPNATEKNLDGFWWKERNNDQMVIEKMFSQGLQKLTDTESDQQAWNKLFKYFNKQKNKGDIGYQKGEKIAVKLNLNNCWNLFGIKDSYVKKDNERDASPQVTKALLKQLITKAGVPQDKITLFDATRKMANWFYDIVYPNFPKVNYVDEAGDAPGRKKVIPSSEKICFVDGTEITLPECVTEADYLINMPLLKKHPINNGATLSGKNFFGTFIEPVQQIHPYHKSGLIMGNAAPQTDLLAHELIGKKTLLYIGDGLYGTLEDHKTIKKFQMYPFNNDWSNSLFFSQDPVAIDSVMYDFLYAEGPQPIEGAQNYMHQAAEPPNNTYDPEKDGSMISKSLGVHEHFDGNKDIFSKERYSGSEKNGIDYIPLGSEYSNPDVIIKKPAEKRLYINNEKKMINLILKEIYEIPTTIIIGNITVEAETNGFEEDIEKISFYLDGELKQEDNEKPFEWNWNEKSLFKHNITVKAHFKNEISKKSEMTVWRLL